MAVGPRTRLYDADGGDREIELEDGSPDRLGDRQLLWVDLDGRQRVDLDRIAVIVGLDQDLVARLTEAPERADLTAYPDHIHLILMAVEPESGDDDRRLVRRPIDVIAGRNWVVTIHDGHVRAFTRFDATTEGETTLGALDAAGFLAAITDEVLADYLELVEAMEREIDGLDERALRHPRGSDVLVEIVGLRRRIGFIRRSLAPHRIAFAALARPEMELHAELGKPWPGLTDRLERALEAVENLRDLLLGTFDIHMGRSAQDTNDVMKVLTLLSAVLLPAVVLAGVMGMNFQPPFFSDPNNFWVVVGAMVALAVGILLVVRRRGWL
jgi:Mg2+ and Co2+ transporter CorA